MTAEERFARIEEKHAALAESVEVLAGMRRVTERNLDRLSGAVVVLAASVRSHQDRLNNLEGGETA
jgi:hypothetical protein